MDKALNDYELIYLVQCHQDGVALEYIFKKYEGLIWKYINIFEIPERDREDVFQEGIIMLYKAVNIFDESYGKTFTKYFELILKRHIIYMKNKLPEFILYENIESIRGVCYIEEESDFEITFSNKLENEIYQREFLKGESIECIKEALNMSEKQIYNARYRIRKKIKDLL